MPFHMDENKKFLFLAFFLLLSVLMIVPILISTLDQSPFSEYSVYPLLDAMLILIVVVSLTGLLTLIIKKQPLSIIKILYITFFIRLAIVFIMSFTGLLPFWFDSDWDQHAIQMATDWNTALNISFESSHNVRYYAILTAFVYFIFQPNPIYMQLINAFFGVLTVFFTYRISLSLFNNRKAAYYAAILIAFWPTHIFFSSMHMRDSIATLLMAAIVYTVIKFLKKGHIKYLIVLVILTLASYLIRQQTGILITLSVLPFITYFYIRKSKYGFKTALSFVFIFLLIPGFFFLLQTNFARALDMDYIVGEMNWRTRGGSAYLQSMTYNSPIDIILYSPIRLFYFLFTPFPWHINSFTQFLTFLESIVLFVITISIIKNRKIIKQLCNSNTLLAFFIFFTFAGLTANAIIDSNTGTSIRHKLQYIYLFPILYTPLILHLKAKKPSSLNVRGLKQ